MMEVETPPAFIVLREAEAAQIQEEGVLSTKIFERVPSNSFVILLRSEEEAMQSAILKHTQHALRAATKQTSWYMLKLTFTVQQWLKLMLTSDSSEPFIERGPRGFSNEWHLRGNLPLHDVTKDWKQVTIGRISVDAFAEVQLAKRPKVAEATCGECGAEKVTVWIGSKGNHRRYKKPEDDDSPKAFCAGCWFSYMSKKKRFQDKVSVKMSQA